MGPHCWSRALSRGLRVTWAAAPSSPLSTATGPMVQTAQPLPAKHSFPMERYEGVAIGLRERLQQEHLTSIVDLRQAPLAGRAEVLLAHDHQYVRAFLAGPPDLDEAAVRAIGFPWSEELVRRTMRITGGTLACTQDVLRGGAHCAGNLAGGTHHAFHARGEGYCIFNDIAVAARWAQHEHKVARCVVIDLDVHQGNGTAAIFANDPSVFTFSIHADKNYPWKSRVAGDLDIAVPDDVSGEQYMSLLQGALAQIADQLRLSSATDTPPTLVFYQAGVDPLKEDRLGRLALSRQDLQRRNECVFAWCLRHGLRCVVTMGGGYSRPIAASVTAHVDAFVQLGVGDVYMVPIHIISYHIISYHIISYRIISYHIILYFDHIISYQITCMNGLL
eukprot:g81649.t1